MNQMNDEIRARFGHTPPAAPGEMADRLDDRFRERFGDDANRSTPRTDEERSWADTFSEIERTVPRPPGSPAPLPGARMSGRNYHTTEPTPSFTDLVRATHRSRRNRSPVSAELDRIEHER